MLGLHKRFILTALSLLFAIGTVSCTQPGQPTGGAGPIQEQGTRETPMGIQTTRESDRMPGLTSRPQQQEQQQRQDQQPQQNATGGAAPEQQDQNGRTVRGSW